MAKQPAQEWMYSILNRPLVTEKSTQLAEGNWISFEVDIEATKPRIKQAVEGLFDVNVMRVNTLIQKGKNKGFGPKKGRRSDFKKAFIQLKEGQTIDLGAGA